MPVESLSALLEQLSRDPKRAFRLLLFMGVLFGFVGATVCLTLWFLQWRQVLPEEAKVEGVEVHFTTTTVDKKRRYFFVVHPQGWQETPVRLNKGDQIEINAAGSITIDMWGINSYSTRRDKIDKSIKAEAITRGKWRPDKSVPEDFYGDKSYDQVMEDSIEENGPLTEAEAERKGMNVVQRIKPARGWTGPSGYAESPGVDTAYPARLKKRVSVDYPYGALLGTIAPVAPDDCTTEMVLKFKPDCTPKRQNIFSVTRSKHPVNPSADGEERALWLIVNDVLDESDPIFPEKFYVDNLGFFYVEVIVTPANH